MQASVWGCPALVLPPNTHLHAMHSGYVRLKPGQSKRMARAWAQDLAGSFQLLPTPLCWTCPAVWTPQAAAASVRDAVLRGMVFFFF